MFTRISLAASLLLFVGCAASVSTNEKLMGQPTPETWAGLEVWDFILVEANGEPAGFIRFQLTDEPADTCAYGSYLARPVLIETEVLPLKSWYEEHSLHAAYEIHGALLRVQLNAPVCDNDIVLSGALSSDGARGQITSSSAFSPKETLIASFDAKLAAVRLPSADATY